MDWFVGPIEQAVTKVKNKKTILIVFVKGSDEKSLSMESLFDSEEIVELCSSCVCLRLVSSSTEAAQFSAIYAVLSVPSLYLISCDGVPLDTVIGDVTKDDLMKKLKNTLQNNEKNRFNNSPAVSVNYQPSPSGQGNENLEEKLEKAQTLLQAKRATEIEEAKEKAKQKEIERREIGKKMKDFKEKQRDKEQAELTAEIRRRRDEEKEARERIKRQIEEDRREKQQRYETERADERSKLEEAFAEKRKEPVSAPSSLPQGITRIQLRFNDGRTMTHQFQSTAQLNEVHEFVRTSAPEGTLGKGSRPKFLLCQLYPKRTFSDTDYSKSLDDLGLSPASAIVVMPQNGPAIYRISSVQEENSVVGVFSSVFNLVMWPFFFLWNLVLGIFSPKAQTNMSQNSRTDTKSPNPTSTNRPKGSSVQREGNTARLRNMDDDSDDNATWNGNSTQQM